MAIQRPDGSHVPLYLSISALVDGEPIFCIIATDLTEHLRSQELRRSEELARRRATELQALFDAVPAAVFIARDSSGRSVEGNDLCYELLRAPRGSAIPFTATNPPGHFRVLKDGVPVPPDALPLQIAASQGVQVRNFELALEFKDGSVRHVLANATPLHDDHGRPSGAVAAFIDITERRKVEEALREGDQRKTDFLAVLSHELRNPLGPIRNSVFMLDRAPPGSDAARRASEVLHRQTEHLTRLVDDLLESTGSPTERSSSSWPRSMPATSSAEAATTCARCSSSEAWRCDCSSPGHRCGSTRTKAGSPRWWRISWATR